jgi:hypothetical protein
VGTSRRRCRAAAGALAAVALLIGCAGRGADDAGAVAAAFENDAADPADRCALLTPAALTALESEASAPCADAISDIPLQGGAVEAVAVWGGNAQVQLSGDTVFLTETAAGWRVVAAACQARGEAPYDCEVES